MKKLVLIVLGVFIFIGSMAEVNAQCYIYKKNGDQSVGFSLPTIDRESKIYKIDKYQRTEVGTIYAKNEVKTEIYKKDSHNVEVYDYVGYTVAGSSHYIGVTEIYKKDGDQSTKIGYIDNSSNVIYKKEGDKWIEVGYVDNRCYSAVEKGRAAAEAFLLLF